MKIKGPIKYSKSSGSHQLMTKATVSGISLQAFLLCFTNRDDWVPPTTTVNFVCLSFFFVFADGYVTISHLQLCA